jgi:hypothetical protein
MTDLVCPLCGKPLSAGPVNLDHVFGEAFGARAKVDVHVACNEKIGGGAEGRLHRANSVLNFFASLNGMSAAKVVGTMPDGMKVTADFSTGQTTLAKPRVLKTEDSQSISLQATGSEEQLRGVLKGWRKRYGDDIPQWKDLTPRQRVSVSGLPQTLVLSLSLDLKDAEAFAVKAAVGAGVLAFGQDFAASQLSSGLREWVRAPFDNPLDAGGVNPRTKLDLLAELDTRFAALAAQMGGLDGPVALPTLVPSDTATNQVVFVEDREKVDVYVHVLGFPVLPYGLSVPGEVPGAMPGMKPLAVLVRERAGILEITDVGQRLMLPVVKAAEAAAQLVEEDDV